MIADLHLHSSCSDGVLDPVALAALCHDRGIRCISVTDHDGWTQNEILAEADLPPGLRWIPGIELSTRHGHTGLDLHVLGYSLTPDEDLLETLATVRDARRARVETMAEALACAGIRVDAASVLRRGQAPGKPDVARVALADPANAERLARAGVHDVGSFIRELLEEGRPGHVPKRKLDAGDAVAAIVRCGGHAVWAHPALDLRRAGGEDRRRGALEAIIDTLKGRGLAGLESVNPAHGADEVALLERTARRHGLRTTAGSDFHDPADRMTGRLLIGYDQEVSWLLG